MKFHQIISIKYIRIFFISLLLIFGFGLWSSTVFAGATYWCPGMMIHGSGNPLKGLEVASAGRDDTGGTGCIKISIVDGGDSRIDLNSEDNKNTVSMKALQNLAVKCPDCMLVMPQASDGIIFLRQQPGGSLEELKESISFGWKLKDVVNSPRPKNETPCDRAGGIPTAFMGGCFLIVATPENSEEKAPVASTPSQAFWTGWLNRDNPGGKGDYETLSDFIAAGLTLPNPSGIDCTTVSGGIGWAEAGQVYSCKLETGGVCVNAEQRDGKCLDYQVRFFYSAGSAQQSRTECFDPNDPDCPGNQANKPKK